VSSNDLCSLSILRRPQVQMRTGLARSTIYDLISAGRFPAPIRLSDRTVGWLEGDVADWIASRVAQSRLDLPTGRNGGVST
jgi:prophage regulatory protein